ALDAVRARMQRQLAADSPRRDALRPAIFRVADDRMADRRHMRAQLVRATGQRLQLDPGGAVAGAVDRPPPSPCRQPMLLVDMHLLAARAWLLRQRGIDLALGRVRYSYHQGPIDLACRAAGEGFG